MVFSINLFSANTNSTKYTPEILKSILLIVLIVGVLVLRFNIKSENQILDIVGSVGFVIIFLILVLCLYCSIARLIVISDNRAKKTLNENPPKSFECVEMTLAEITSLVENNNCINIVILAKKKVAFIGASSTTKNMSSKFYDKRYYINDTNYREINVFLSNIQVFQSNGKILVYAIDDVKINQ